MASNLTSRSLLARNANEDILGFGSVGKKGSFGKHRWNAVRHGEIWINGLFFEPEVHLNGDICETAGSSGVSESWRDGRSEVDWITEEIASLELNSKEESASCDSLGWRKRKLGAQKQELDLRTSSTAVIGYLGEWHTSEGFAHEPPGLEGKEKFLKAGWQRGKEWASDGFPFKSTGVAEALDAFGFALAQKGSIETAWSSGDLAWDRAGKDTLQGAGVAHVNQLLPHKQMLNFPKAEVEGVWMTRSIDWNFKKDASSGKGNSHGKEHPLGKCGEMVVAQQMPGAGCDSQKKSGEDFLTEGNGRGKIWPAYTFEEKRQGGQLVSGDEVVLEENEAVVFVGGIQGTPHEYVAVCQEGNGEILGTVAQVSGMHDYVTDFTQEASKHETLSSGGRSAEDEGKPEVALPEALSYALSYLSVRDLMAMEAVCKSLREFIRNDVLLWRRLHIEPPLSKKLTDETLIQLASRSKGQLQCLSLVDCFRVTEVAVEQVVNLNPRLSKLCLPGCSRITAEALVRIVKAHTVGMPGLKQLRIRNIYGLTREHLDCLQSMLQNGKQNESNIPKPQFYHNGHNSSLCDDDRLIDVEACPKCGNARLVYDCTRERCQQSKGSKLQQCRGCIFCIARCEECGRCINDNEYEETFCLDLLCSACWIRLPKCSECNRPGCGRHADHFIRRPETTFVCIECCSSAPGASGPEFHVVS